MPGDYVGPERRKALHFTETQLDELADRAAERAVDRMTNQAYRVVGKTVIDRLSWIVGVLVCGFALWAAKHGWFDK